MHRFKQVILITLIILLMIVMVQNAQPITFHFLNWQYQVSQLLLVVIVFVIGFLIGFATAKWPRRRSGNDSEATTFPR